MKNLCTNRANLSNGNIRILKNLVFGEDCKEEVKMKEVNNNNYYVANEHKVHENALGVLYRNLNDNKNQRKPMVYFFVGFIIGVISMLFLSAVLLVSDKDTIESDVKSVKETIIDNEKTDLDTSVVNENPVVQADEIDENGARIYVVKEGDTLGGIVSRLYGSSYDPEKVAKFKEVNNLKNANVLSIGQKLVIPD